MDHLYILSSITSRHITALPSSSAQPPAAQSALTSSAQFQLDPKTKLTLPPPPPPLLSPSSLLPPSLPAGPALGQG